MHRTAVPGVLSFSDYAPIAIFVQMCYNSDMEKIKKIRDLFLLFIIFAVCGWIYEVLLTAAAYGYYQNRGFLFGPWLPIYGFGGLLLYLVFGKAEVKQGSPLRRLLIAAEVFAGICLISAAFELAASYLLDALGIGFTSLWDYFADTPNFEGRISLVASLRFGVIGIVALYIVIPLWKRLVKLGEKPLNAVSAVLAVLFAADLICRIPFGSNAGF